MQGPSKHHPWIGKISIIGSSVKPCPAEAERRRVRSKLKHLSRFATSISIARTTDEVRQAENLVRSAYSRLGYDTKFLDARPGEQDETPFRTTLLATLDGQLAGTFSARPDGPDGVRADVAFPEEINAVRKKGSAIIELGQFAILPLLDFQTSQMIQSALHNGVYLLSSVLTNRPTSLVFEVHPHHVKYWHSLGWQPTGVPRHCERVNAPGVLMVADVTAYSETMKQCWSMHARTTEKTCHPWDRIVRYSMLWEDVGGVLHRINGDRPPRSDTPDRCQLTHPAVPADFTTRIPDGLSCRLREGNPA